MKNEIWEPISVVDGVYLISNYGRVKSLPRSVFGFGKNKWQTRKGKILKLETTKLGYKRAALSYNGIIKRYFVHRLVAMAFIKNPLNKPHINHINSLPYDNRVENLEWCTQSENNIHAYKYGNACVKGIKSPACKLNEKQVMEIFNSKDSSYKVCKKYPVSARTVRDIRCGRSWGFLTGKKHNPKKIKK